MAIQYESVAQSIDSRLQEIHNINVVIHDTINTHQRVTIAMELAKVLSDMDNTGKLFLT
jgi:hypothetical protein